MNKIKTRWKNQILLVLLLIIFSFQVVAVPPLPTEIYGTAKSYNQYIMPGTLVNVYDSESNLCGQFRAQNTSWNFSKFGVLTCRGEDEYLAGPTEGENLTFKIGLSYASAVAVVNGSDPRFPNYTQINVSWESGSFKEVILVAPPLICGDSFCDSFENCKTCEVDCHACPVGNATSGGNNTGNVTPGNGTGGAGGGGTGGGGSAGGAGGSGGSAEGETEGGESSGGAEAQEGEAPEEEECLEEWMCGDWQQCLPINQQYRDCADVNECGTSNEMPDVVQDCDYNEAIFISNETVPIRNGTTPRQESPALISICTDKLPLLSAPSIIFIVLLVIILLLAQLDYKRRLKKIETDSALDELKRLELHYFEKRKKIIFFVVIIVLAAIVYLYHYFFYVCRDKYVMYLWLLATGILMTPVIVHLVIESSIFSEAQKNRRVSVINDIHYRHFGLLIEIADRELISAEKNIMDRIYALEMKSEFSSWLAKDKIVAKIYADMNKLFNLYKTLKNPMFVEKDLLESIKKLDEDEQFMNAAKQYPELMAIRANLSLLYAAYEYKQTLYDELSNIEKEYGITKPILR